MDQERDRKLKELMVKAQEGDAVAYELLLDDLYGELKGYVKAAVSQNVDDVLQEILVTIHRMRHTYDPRRPFLPWVYAIAKHRILDSKRAAWRLYRKTSRLADEVKREESEPRSSNEALRDAISELSANQREVVTMLKLQGYSVQEISEKLSLSVSAVKVTAHRAYQTLRKKLTEESE